jgi:phage terminase Nu1 subunit (DNA packaging protein)
MATADALTSSQLAELIGVSQRRIHQMADEGNPPPKNANGRFPCRESGLWMRDRIISQLGVASNGEAYDFNAERARLTFHQANLSALDEEIKRKNVIPAETVQHHWETMAGNVRAKLLNLPGRLAVKVTGHGTVQDAEREARELIHEALQELSGNGIP